MVSEHQMEPHSSLSKGQVPQTNTAKYKKIIQKALEECDIDSDDGFQIVN